jgi:hypothetical protein
MKKDQISSCPLLTKESRSFIFDEIVKSRHSRAGGNPESAKLLKILDSCFHGNDGKAHFQTFYETIIFGATIFPAV